MTNDIIDVESVEDEVRRKEELNHPNFRKWFAGLLKEIEVNLTFKKANGEIRKMRCTLNEELIPDDKKSTSNGKRKSPQDSIAVYDLDKQDWRSFRYDSIIEFEGELTENYPSHPEPVIIEEIEEEIDDERK
jgi:hypothetical protein